MSKVLCILYARLENLLDEELNLFFEERAFLEEDIEPKLLFIPRRCQLELELKEVLKAIDFEEFLQNQKPQKEASGT